VIPAPGQKITLTIEWDPAGGAASVVDNMNGAVISNKVMAYGLFEMAKELVQDAHAKAQQQRVQLTPPGMRVVPPNGK
jgi:hypothetical protein